MKFSTTVIGAFLISAIVLILSAFNVSIFNSNKTNADKSQNNLISIKQLSTNSLIDPSHYNRSIMTQVSNQRISRKFLDSFPQQSCIQASSLDSPLTLSTPFISIEADQPLIPASINKMVTSAVVLSVLSRKDTLDTNLITSEKSSEVTRAYLQISGDPSFVSTLVAPSRRPKFFSPQHVHTFDDLADRIAKARIRSIDTLVIDDTWFQLPEIEQGWSDDRSQVGQLGGLLVDEGFDGTTLATSTRNTAVSVLTSVFSKYSIHVGNVVFGEIPNTVLNEKNIVATTSSSSIEVLLSDMLKTSNNVYAEQLLAASIHKSLGIVTKENRQTFVFDRLKALGVKTNGYEFVNASGYSHQARSTCELGQEIISVVKKKYSIDLTKISSNARKDGTLTERFLNSDYSLSAKTGTLAGVTALTGTLENKFVFTFISNGSFSQDQGHRYQEKMITILESYPAIKTLTISPGVLATR